MGRIKADERELSYHARGRCFRKFYRGRMYYLDPRKVAKSDDSAYRQALKNWEALKEQIDLEARASKLASVPAMLPPGIDPTMLMAMNVRAAMSGLPTTQQAGNKQTTIQGLVAAYIANKQALADSGQISRQMFIEYQHNASVFGEWAEQCGYHKSEQINASCLDDYRQFVLRLSNPAFALKAQTPSLGLVSIRKRLARLKNMIEWAYENEHLEALPRNTRNLAKIRATNGHDEAEKPPEHLFWTAEEARTLFNAATERTKLYILLAANCGYTQTDIATLTHSHIDWESGIITRPRHKTGGKTAHKLWPLTLSLLKSEATKADKKQPGNGLVLLSSNGLPLIHESEKTKTRQDTIRLAFAMVQKTLIKQRLRQSQPELFALATRAKKDSSPAELKAIRQEKAARATKIKHAIRAELKNENRSFKSFRKTSANLIEREYGDGSKLSDQFLGHTQKATKRFYVAEHYETLFAAIEWLESQYSFSIK